MVAELREIYWYALHLSARRVNWLFLCQLFVWTVYISVMATSKQSFNSPPVMRTDLLYTEWKTELDIWSDFTDLTAERQGGALFLTLTGKARQAVLSGVPREKIKSASGLKAITDCLDELYEKDKSQSGYAAYDDFTNYRRSATTNIQDYLVEFNLKYNKIKIFDMKLPDGVLAYYLLKCANLSEEQTNMCKATCATLTYKDMRKQIEKITTSAGSSESSHSDTQNITVQPQFYGLEYEEGDYEFEYEEEDEPSQCDAYYAQQSQYQFRPRTPQPGASSNFAPGPRLNTPDEFGNPTQCSFCRSTYHYVGRCPDAALHAVSRPRGGSGFRRPGRGRGVRGTRGRPFFDRNI